MYDLERLINGRLWFSKPAGTEVRGFLVGNSSMLSLVLLAKNGMDSICKRLAYSTAGDNLAYPLSV